MLSKTGVFDSGLGGLVITSALIKALPQYDYLYLGDTAHLPYGDKTSGRILKYTLDSLNYLISQDCKLIIIACNTATSICLRYIQQKYIPAHAPDVKVLGVVIPTVEVALSDNCCRIGVIATQATTNSHIYQTELKKINPNISVTEIATPRLVPMIEHNCFDDMEETLRSYLAQFPKLDSLILGCTHYPLIKEYCRRLLPQTKIISQDELMGAKLADYLHRHPEIETKLSRNGQRNFCVTRKNIDSERVAQQLYPQINVAEISILQK